MAKEICKLCGKKVTATEGRSQHLRKVHGIDSRWKGAVRYYFQEHLLEKKVLRQNSDGFNK
jgi:hypothetical protein